MIGVLLVSGYVLWSNGRTYRDAEDVYSELLALKPDDGSEEGGDLSGAFDDLRQINSDIKAWLTVRGTKVDYPVVQGENNIYYMNKDVYKETSLAGSIFLDSRNRGDFSDPYLLIYGHHMDRGLMFGDLDLFKDGEFFDSTRDATITTVDGKADYKVLAVMDVIDSVKEIFDPFYWGRDLTGLHDYIEGHSIRTWGPAMDEFDENPTESQVVALVTCTSGQTGTRLVVFLYRHVDGGWTDPDVPTPVPPTPDDDKPGGNVPKTGDTLYNSPVFWIVVLAAAAAAFSAFAVVYVKQKKNKKEKK